MATFRDGSGRDWAVTITVATVKRVKSLLGLDLLKIEDNLIGRVADDPVLLCDLLYAVCKPQADECGVADSAFGELLAGDVLDAATDAFLEELVGFFPRHRRRVLAAVLAKQKDLLGAVAAKAMARVEELTLDQLTSGEKSTGSPASSAATPAP